MQAPDGLPGFGTGKKKNTKLDRMKSRLGSREALKQRLDSGDDRAKEVSSNLECDEHLKELRIKPLKLGEEGAKRLAPVLGEIGVIMSLELSNLALGDKGLKHLGKSLIFNPSLAVLNLAQNGIGDEGCLHLARSLKHLGALKCLYLSHNRITGVGCGHIVKAIFDSPTLLTSLETVELNHNNIGQEGCHHLYRFISSTKALTSLDLSENDIGQDACAHVAAALSLNRSLTSLRLSRNRIGNDGCRSLAEHCARNRSLKKLHLSNNEIGNVGCIYLERLLGNGVTPLATLTLSGNSFQDKGIFRIARALASDIHGLYSPGLVTLDLSSNPGVGDEGWKYLADLAAKNASLGNLDLSKNQMESSTYQEVERRIAHNPSIIALLPNDGKGGHLVMKQTKEKREKTERWSDACCGLVRTGDGAAIVSALSSRDVKKRKMYCTGLKLLIQRGLLSATSLSTDIVSALLQLPKEEIDSDWIIARYCKPLSNEALIKVLEDLSILEIIIARLFPCKDANPLLAWLLLHFFEKGADMLVSKMSEKHRLPDKIVQQLGQVDNLALVVPLCYLLLQIWTGPIDRDQAEMPPGMLDKWLVRNQAHMVACMVLARAIQLCPSTAVSSKSVSALVSLTKQKTTFKQTKRLAYWCLEQICLTDQSIKYNLYDCLAFEDRINRTTMFCDLGYDDNVGLLDEIREKIPLAHDWALTFNEGPPQDTEALYIDYRSDQFLSNLRHEAKAYKSLPEREKVERIASLVVHVLDGWGRGSTTSGYAARMDSNTINVPVMPLGRVHVGTSRHRALLFKFLGDSLFVRSCLVRGQHPSGDIYAWNIVNIGETESLQEESNTTIVITPADNHNNEATQPGGSDPTQAEPPLKRSQFLRKPNQCRTEGVFYVVDLMHEPVRLYKLLSDEAEHYARSGSNATERSFAASSARRRHFPPESKEADFRKLRQISNKTYEAQHVHDETPRFVIKEIPYRSDRLDREKILMDRTNVALLRHPNIVQQVSVWERETCLAVLMDREDCTLEVLLTCNELDARIPAWLRTEARQLQRSLAREEVVVMCFLLDITMALRYLHKTGVVYSDLRTATCLVNIKAQHVKLCDCNHSQFLTTVNRRKSDEVWQADKVLSTAKVRKATSADILALGLLISELLTGHKPANSQQKPAQLSQIIKTRSATLFALYKQCTHHDPLSRPTAQEVIDALVRTLITIYV